MSAAPHCTVVIPTKNGMPRFAAVLDAVLRQRAPWPFDVVVVDSGSRDGTDALAEAAPGVRVLRIPPAEFGHGRTRNLAIAATPAPFCALLTQDAQPADDGWLARLVAGFDGDARIAGVFGRHVAWPEADPFTRRELERHFDAFLADPRVVWRDLDPAREAADPAWRQRLHFYSDNNSCLRRAVWERIPYPDVDFAEDQLWARAILEQGWRKAYAHDAEVFHSHDYGTIERLQRAFDESRNFKRRFGYDLAPGPLRAARTALALARDDIGFAVAPGGRGPKLRALPRRLVQDAMLAAGHWLGNRHDRLPAPLCRALSRDHALFALGQTPSGEA